MILLANNTGSFSPTRLRIEGLTSNAVIAFDQVPVIGRGDFQMRQREAFEVWL